MVARRSSSSSSVDNPVVDNPIFVVVPDGNDGTYVSSSARALRDDIVDDIWVNSRLTPLGYRAAIYISRLVVVGGEDWMGIIWLIGGRMVGGGYN